MLQTTTTDKSWHESSGTTGGAHTTHGRAPVRVSFDVSQPVVVTNLGRLQSSQLARHVAAGRPGHCIAEGERQPSICSLAWAVRQGGKERGGEGHAAFVWFLQPLVSTRKGRGRGGRGGRFLGGGVQGPQGARTRVCTQAHTRTLRNSLKPRGSSHVVNWLAGSRRDDSSVANASRSARCGGDNHESRSATPVLSSAPTKAAAAARSPPALGAGTTSDPVSSAGTHPAQCSARHTVVC